LAPPHVSDQSLVVSVRNLTYSLSESVDMPHMVGNKGRTVETDDAQDADVTGADGVDGVWW
jgi:hypothetical protein